MKIVFKNDSQMILEEKPVGIWVIIGVYFTILFSFVGYFSLYIPDYFSGGNERFVLFLLIAGGVWCSILLLRFTKVVFDKETNKITVLTSNVLRKNVVEFPLHDSVKLIAAWETKIVWWDGGPFSIKYLSLYILRSNNERIALNPINWIIGRNDPEEATTLCRDISAFLKIEFISQLLQYVPTAEEARMNKTYRMWAIASMVIGFVLFVLLSV